MVLLGPFTNADFTRQTWRDCLESSWTGCIARLLLARGAENETFTLVPQALGTTKWILSGVSRQSLEGVFSELRIDGVLRSPHRGSDHGIMLVVERGGPGVSS